MKKSLGAFQLAAFLNIIMIVDHIAWRVAAFSTIEAQVIHFLGSIIMPIVCYIVVRVFKSSANSRNFLLRMIGFWIISIYPYKSFMGNSVPFRQNLFFEMVLVLGTISIIESIEKKNLSKLTALLAILNLILFGLLIGENPILTMSYALLFYREDLTKNPNKKRKMRFIAHQILITVGVFFMNVAYNVAFDQIWYQEAFILGALFASPIIIFFSESAEAFNRLDKLFYYAYPIQLLILGIAFRRTGYSFNQFYLNLNIITAILMVGYGFLALKAKPSQAQLANIIMLIFGLFFITGFYIQLTAKDIRIVQVALKIEYTGMVGVIMAFTKFVDEFYDAKFSKWIYVIEEIVSACVIVNIYSVEKNNIFFKYIILSNTKEGTKVYAKPGLAYVVFLIYVIWVFSHIITFAIRNMRRSKKEEKRRCLYLVLGAICPSICIFIKAVGLAKGYDFMTFGILGFIFFFTIALIKDEYFDTMITEAEKDPLTGVCNRRYFVEMVELNLSRRKKGSLIMVDLDNFKTINDRYGHGVGDRVLITLGDSLKQAIPEINLISRIGGDEFCIYMVNVTRKDELERIVENLVKIFRNNVSLLKLNICATLSIGISVYKGKSNMEFEMLYEEADKALYLAKNSGKSQHKFY